MRTYIMSLGFDIWKLVMIGYTTPTNPPTNTIKKKASENDAKSMNAILCGLLESEFVKVMHCKSTKEIWDKI
jgi:hypothetical protein